MLGKRVFFGLIALFTVSILIACSEETEISSIQVDQDTVQSNFFIDDFDLNDIQLVVSYEDGSEETVDVTEDMVSEEDLKKLSQSGMHTIEIEYENVSTSLDMKMVESDLDVQLLSIYEQGVSEDAIDGTYEEWLESIEGKDGVSIEDATINDDGELVLTYSDDTETNVGNVLGSKGEDGREIELRTHDGKIEWRYDNETGWTYLASLDELKGDDGTQGISVDSTEINDSGELIIHYSDDTKDNIGDIIKYHTVKFVDFNGYVLDVQFILDGETASAPDEPTREGYDFTGWNGSYESITKDETVIAEYETKTYTVKFLDDSGTLLKEEKVLHGENATPPEYQPQDGYCFEGWDKTFDTIKSDKNIQAIVNDCTIIIGSEEFSGEFIDWGGSSSYDLQIRESINGSALVATDKDTGEYTLNETILTEDSVDYLNDEVVPATFDPDNYNQNIFDQEGNKSYEFEIKDDLKFSDGEDITAEDYAFSIKMESAYAVGQAGHTALVGGEDLVGYDEWTSGESDEFEGVEVVDDQTIRLTISAEELPYYYELAMVAYGPQPEHIYTNDSEYDFLTAEEFSILEEDETHIGEYIYDMISSPPVSSGPYVLDHYEQDQYVRMSRNENYAGDYRGHTPSIENVIVRVVPSSTKIDHLIEEEIDVLTEITEGKDIDRAIKEDHLYSDDYARNGYGGLFIQTDFGHSQDYRVRQAIAYMIDREDFVDQFLGGYGDIAHAPYGFGQWMLEATAEDGNNVLEDLNTYDFDKDLTRANELLDEAGYSVDENGDDWDNFEDSGTRYHEETGEELTLGWLGTESDYSDVLSTYLTANMEEAGVNFSARQAGFDQLLDNYYYAYELEDDEREWNMFNLATSYNETYDPYNSYHSDNLGSTYNTSQFEDSPENPQVDDFTEQAGYNFSWIVDHENNTDGADDETSANEYGLTVDELTERMRRLTPEQNDQFLEYWEALTLRLNRLLPVVPLYSNQYYHFANERIEGLELTGFWDWQQNIVDWEIIN